MTEQSKNYPVLAFLICLIAYAASQMDLALFGYVLPLLRKDFGFGIEVAGRILAVSFLIGSVLIVWLGSMADKFGRKTMFQFALVASGIIIALHAFARNVEMITFLRGLSIATGGLLYPVTGAIVAEEAPARYRGLYAGFLQTGYPFGWFVAPFLAAPLQRQYGWRGVFLLGLLSLPLVLLVRLWLREPQRFAKQQEELAKRRPFERLGELFTPEMRRRTITLWLGQFLFVIAYGGSAFLLPTYLHEARGFEVIQAGYLSGIANGIGILGYIIAAFVGEFVLTRRNTIIIWAWLGTLAFLALLWLASTWGTVLAAYALMTMFFYGTAAVKFAFIGEHFPTRLRATGLAFSGSFAVTLGSALGPLMVAYAVRHLGWNWAFSCFAVVPLFLSGLVFLALKPLPSGLEVEAISEAKASNVLEGAK